MMRNCDDDVTCESVVVVESRESKHQMHKDTFSGFSESRVPLIPGLLRPSIGIGFIIIHFHMTFTVDYTVRF